MPTRRTILWTLFAVQAVCCVYFLSDTFFDLVMPTYQNALAESDIVEGVVTIALFFGLAFTWSELRAMMRREDRITDQLKVASGAFAELLELRFDEWALTEAERSVAVMALKGYSVAEMAALRDTAQGTVKAQCAALYRKADVSGRLQLLSLFLDDLMAETLLPAR
ncbi:helix-turn-helix transcriptional regulator [uncultured Tateyamaria sp.]|uniref:helix-turn-helix transcriptional regulator n=1 Tax=uncultured Tateyamaria sp. TaxID=455651 RepID=UPI00260EFC8B|nr:helix-turn-helix transcriptional regulator [uncultured Tateyamaria sp.]